MFSVNAERANDIELSGDECLELGFDHNALKCSACDYLPRYNLEEIYTDCKRCCVEDRTETHEVV